MLKTKHNNKHNVNRTKNSKILNKKIMFITKILVNNGKTK